MTLNNLDRGLQDLFAPGTGQLEPLSASNARVKRLRRIVRDTKTRSTERVFVVEGEKAVLAALASPLRVEQLFVGQSFLPTAAPMTDHSVESPPTAQGPVDCFCLGDDVLASQLNTANPQLVAAVVARPAWTADQFDTDGHIVAAVEIRDPGNLGTIIRTVEASGGAGLVIVGPSVDQYNPKVVRASAGSILRVPIIAVTGLPELAQLATRVRRQLVATVLTEAAVPYDSAELSKAIIMVGNEPRGLTSEAISLAEVAVTIPTAASVESLNVAAATAVLCFESARQARQV